jgi:hypothetical protein
MLITAFISARHLSISWASPIQPTHPHPTSRRSVLILSSHLCLGLPSGLLPSGFPTKTLYAPLLSPIRATCPAHLISSASIAYNYWCLLVNEFGTLKFTFLRHNHILCLQFSSGLLWKYSCYLVDKQALVSVLKFNMSVYFRSEKTIKH